MGIKYFWVVSVAIASFGCEALVGADFGGFTLAPQEVDAGGGSDDEPPVVMTGSGGTGGTMEPPKPSPTSNGGEDGMPPVVEDEPCTPGERVCAGAALQLCAEDQTLRTVQLCASAALCKPPACEPPTCGESDARCEGAELQLCNEDRDGWELFQICDSEAHCSTLERQCTVDPCTPGTVQCSGAELQRCEQAPRGWNTIQSCATPALCDVVAGGCVEPSCKPDETRCDGPNFQRCNGGRTDFVTEQLCASADLCDPMEGCDSPACLPSEHHCTDKGELEVCNADQTGWITLAQCFPSVLCNPTARRCDSEVVKGETRCNGARREELKEDADGKLSWVLEETCVNSALCTPDGCKPVACVPDEHRCSGAALQRCNDELTGWVDVEECGSAALCKAEEQRCAPIVCRLDQCECSGKALQACKADLTGYENVEDCGSAAECDAKACMCADPCTPGVVRCNGRVLETCRDKLEGWETLATCVTRQLCNEGEERCDPVVCRKNQFDCDGKELKRCANGRHKFNFVRQCDVICDAPNGQCDVCEPRRFSCDENDLKRCSADGQTQVQQQECPDGLCNSTGASGECLQCTPAGDIRCDGATLLECSENQKREDQVGACGSATLCDDENDRCLLCEPVGALRCQGADLFACEADQLGEELLGTCVSPEICERTVAEGQRMCEPGDCKAGAFICDGDILKECNDARTDYDPVKTCAADEVCDSANKRCSCVDGEFRCGMGVLERCIDGVFEAADTCVGGTLRTCEGDALTEMACADDTKCSSDGSACQCPTGAFRCAAGQLEKCVDGSFAFNTEICTPAGTVRECMGDVLGTVNCPAKTTCNDVADACVCTPDDFRCTAGELEKCAGTTFGTTTEVCMSPDTIRQCMDDSLSLASCPVATLCSNETGTCACNNGDLSCASGALQECQNGVFVDIDACDGATLRTCGPDGVEETTCVTGTSCDSAAKECTCDALFSCNGDTLQECVMGVFSDSMNVCAGDEVRSCDAGALSSSPCPEGLTCSNEAGGCTCTADTFSCIGTTLHKCTTDSATMTNSLTASTEFCVDTDTERNCASGTLGTPDCAADAACVDGAGCVCTDGAYSCSGTNLQKCVGGMREAADDPMDACANPSTERVCVAGELGDEACEAGTSCQPNVGCACTAGTLRCNMGELELCSGGGFVGSQPVCSGATARVCEPGMSTPTETICMGGETCDEVEGCVAVTPPMDAGL